MKNFMKQMMITIIIGVITFGFIMLATSPSYWYENQHDANCECILNHAENCNCYERMMKEIKK